MFNFRSSATLLCTALAISACTTITPSEEAITSRPDLFDAQQLTTFLTSAVEDNRTVGASVLIYVDGQEAYFGAAGLADREARTAMRRSTLSNIYSMTKPVTGVTLMTLYEDGLFDLEDPLSDYLPEFKDMQVMTGVDLEGEMVLEPASRPIKIIDLMRHSSGFGYGWQDSPIADAYNEHGLLDPGSTLESFSQDLSELPLFFQPGTRWHYSVSVDVQARLAEVIGGKPFAQLVEERVLSPLGMTETSYHAPNNQKHRVSAVYLRGEDGALKREPDKQVYGFWTEKPSFTPGGHGLVSTLDDYMTFALMLQNEGSYNGTEILTPETIALMAKDHLPDDVVDTSWLTTKGQVGFGLNFAVRVAPPESPRENKGSVGEFFWDGRATTLFWVDPEEELTAVFFTQVVPFDTDLIRDLRKAVYAGLKSPE